ncbi:IclR family transcriptional regulator [Neobacillus notoginsengisoli]|uniref:IclR family transcriptional regulator n=1 Tax=Neobacillus notoginsengisoli TaxID=1578198 RepID=A0A417YYH3_9BACI|nr:IclR family transcriptional regulator [Neobacillus notoginsengisoli]RHW42781.1 IclR family transcriptional regulator [Neobacillus notoginsengisoli]
MKHWNRPFASKWKKCDFAGGFVIVKIVDFYLMIEGESVMRELSSRSGSVEKALRIVECFDLKHPSLSLEELSVMTGFPKPTVFRMICSLEKFGYIRRAAKEGQLRFQLGMGFLEKSQIVNSQLDIRASAKKEMLRLRNETNLSVQLAIRDGQDAVYVEQFEALKLIRVFPQVGRRVPLYAAACPRVLLAVLPEEEQKAILAGAEYQLFTPHTKTDEEQILEELAGIRRDGYAVSKGELYEGTIAVAVPIKNINAEVLAALSVIGTEQDFEDEKIDVYIEKLMAAARNIEADLG